MERESRPWCYHWIVPWIKLYPKLCLFGLLLPELIMSLFPYPLARATSSCHLTARGTWTLAITYESFLCASHCSKRCRFIISFISHRSSDGAATISMLKLRISRLRRVNALPAVIHTRKSLEGLFVRSQKITFASTRSLHKPN